jgi:EamA-like transporter family
MTQRKDYLDSTAYALLLACCVFWGFQQVLVKATVVEIPPVFQVAVRFAGATALLWLWCRWRGVPLWQRDGTLWPGLLVGVLFSFEFACIYIGLQHTGASRLTVFLYTAPFWVAALLPFLCAANNCAPCNGWACCARLEPWCLRCGTGCAAAVPRGAAMCWRWLRACFGDSPQW